jgi:hypothetical protein
VETKREQRPLAHHPLETTREFDLGDGERVTEMKTSVHVRVRERSKPLWILRPDLGRSHGPGLRVNGFGIGGGGGRGSVDLEDFLVEPVLLSLLFDFNESISLAGLSGGFNSSEKKQLMTRKHIATHLLDLQRLCVGGNGRSGHVEYS